MKYFMIFVSIFLFVLSNIASARVHDYMSTRLKSTAGTGVGSLLLNESNLLNPAPLAFFGFSTINFQKGRLETNQAQDRGFTQENYKSHSGTTSLTIADANDQFKGAVGYYDKKEGIEERQRYAFSYGIPVAKMTSIGFTVRHSREKNNFYGDRLVTDNYTQTILGTTHAINEQFTVGFVAIDPLRTKKEDTIGIVGFQYLVKNILALMLDFGVDPLAEETSESLLYRGAMQLNLFSDFYARGGISTNKKLGEKGTGFGIAWVGPKLALDLALMSTKPINDPTSYLKPQEKVKESSLALTYKF